MTAKGYLYSVSLTSFVLMSVSNQFVNLIIKIYDDYVIVILAIILTQCLCTMKNFYQKQYRLSELQHMMKLTYKAHCCIFEY